MNPAYSPKTVGVTGPTGLIGSHLVAALLQRGYRVRVVVHHAQHLQGLQHTLQRFDLADRLKDVEIDEISLLNPLRLSRWMEGCDGVFHCAGLVTYDPQRSEEVLETNRSITAGAVTAARMARVGVFLHVSSIATLGTVETSQSLTSAPLITEKCWLTSPKGRSAYSMSKFYAENEVWRAAAQGLRTIIVNPAIVLGEGEWDRSSGPLIVRAVQGFPFYTEGVKGYVDVRDVARAMITLFETPQALGQRFILCGANLSFRELFTLIAQAAHKRPPRWRAGRQLLNVAATLERGHRRFWGGEGRLSASVIDNALDVSRYDGSLITRTCQFHYTPIEQTIQRVVNAYLQEKHVIKSASTDL